MICRDGMVGAAGRAAHTKHLQPPLQTIPVVVPYAFILVAHTQVVGLA
jgi:hypothetical protein